MIIMVNSLEWLFLFRFSEVESSGKPWKAIEAESVGGRRQPLLPCVSIYCLSFKRFFEDGCCTHGIENILHLASSDLLHFCECLQDHGIILEF